MLTVSEGELQPCHDIYTPVVYYLQMYLEAYLKTTFYGADIQT